MNVGSKRFHELLTEIGDLHDAKQQDYGSATDPFANVRATQDWGIPAWVGAMIRLNDKVVRLKSMVRNGFLRNEPVEDSLMDIAVYALIARVLWEEECARDLPVLRAGRENNETDSEQRTSLEDMPNPQSRTDSGPWLRCPV